MGENIAKVVDEWKKMMIGSSTCATIGGDPRISNSGIYDPNIIVGLDIWAQRGLSGLGMIDTNKKSEDVIKTLDELADRIGYKEDSIYYSRFKEIAEKYDEKELRDCLNILIYGNERTGDNKTIYDIDSIILARAICYLDDRIPYISGISKKDKEWREWLTDRAQEVSTQ